MSAAAAGSRRTSSSAAEKDVEVPINIFNVVRADKAAGNDDRSKLLNYVDQTAEDSFYALRSEDALILNDEIKRSAGTSFSDWAAFCAGMWGLDDDEKGYLDALRMYVEKKYSEGSSGLSKNRTTEWHRIGLTVLACGGDPRHFGKDPEGNDIDLVRDGTYECMTGTPWKQGINGAVYALLLLDAGNYDVPENARYTREDLVSYILEKEIDGGGFALTGKLPDPDITAMVLQALAPYAKDNTAVREAVERAVSCISDMQDRSGGYKSYGTLNAESTSQVICAVTALGIDPFNDERFISADGNNLFDGLMQFHLSNGGFSHSDDGMFNVMADEQALCALISLKRYINGEPGLYVIKERDKDHSLDLPAEITEPPEETQIPEISASPESSSLPEETESPPEASEASGSGNPAETEAPEPHESEKPAETAGPYETGETHVTSAEPVGSEKTAEAPEPHESEKPAETAGPYETGETHVTSAEPSGSEKTAASPEPRKSEKPAETAGPYETGETHVTSAEPAGSEKPSGAADTSGNERTAAEAAGPVTNGKPEDRPGKSSPRSNSGEGSSENSEIKRTQRENEALSEKRKPSGREETGKKQENGKRDLNGKNDINSSEAAVFGKEDTYDEKGYLHIGGYLVSYRLITGALLAIIIAAASVLTAVKVKRGKKSKSRRK